MPKNEIAPLAPPTTTGLLGGEPDWIRCLYGIAATTFRAWSGQLFSQFGERSTVAVTVASGVVRSTSYGVIHVLLRSL